MSTALLLATILAQSADPPAVAAPAPRVQVALLLDTSGSMEGLIRQAQEQLWRIVDAFARVRKDGRPPRVEVALYQYGSIRHPAECGYLARLTELTDDLDLVSEQLFGLTAAGGDEFAGLAIRRATEELAWSGSADDLKVIVLAGNETLTQGKVDWKQACTEAIARGISVNTIYCGTDGQARALGWEEAAQLAEGSCLTISEAAEARAVALAEDEELLRLDQRLNQTYVPFGAAGRAAQVRQVAQDQNARQLARGTAVDRAAFKGSALYVAAHWDLVDAVTNGRVKLEEVADADLPESWRGRTLAEKQEFVEHRSAARKGLQQQIRTLADRRRAAAAAAHGVNAAAGRDTLSVAVDAAVRRLAAARQLEVLDP